MKIKHVATLLIPFTLFGVWSSYRLFLVYLSGENGQMENNLPTVLRSSPSSSSSSWSSAVLAITNNTAAKTTTAATATAPTLNKNENQITTKPKIITSMPPPKSDTFPAETKPSQPPKPNTSEHNYKDSSKPYSISEEPAGESFSACLKWMDDYRQLGEWLAYHYHVLPLRYLVFFRDPKSTTDPQPIFDRWADRIQVEYWTNNSDFMTKDQQKTIDNMSIDTKKHRRAQRFFYYSCIKHLHEKNRTWAILIDTDEYLVLDSNNIPDVHDKLQKPGAALDVIRKVHAKDPSFVPKSKTPEKWFENCTVMTRKEYPAFESSKALVVNNKVPTGIDPYRFVTLRFRHRGQKLIGKSMVDVSTLDFANITWRDVYSHNLFDSCKNTGSTKNDLMYVGHYLGSMEAYQRPADRRNDWMNRTKKFYKLNAKSEKILEKGKGDDEVRPWIQGFAASVGLEQMQYLLQDVGFPYNATTALAEVE